MKPEEEHTEIEPLSEEKEKSVDTGTNVGKTVVISEGAYNSVNMLKAKLSAKKGKALSWDEFFKQLISTDRKKENLISWLYTLGIFVTITFIMMFPFFILTPNVAMAMLPVFIVIGLIAAVFSAYVLTPWTLREFKPFENAPQEILKSIEELSKKAEITKYVSSSNYRVRQKIQL
jgi:VIT1/CCC1 family predicted Fe2+/Mn2+ transporter